MTRLSVFWHVDDYTSRNPCPITSPFFPHLGLNLCALSTLVYLVPHQHKCKLCIKIILQNATEHANLIDSYSPKLISSKWFSVFKDMTESFLATHSSVLAWRIPGTGEPGGLPSMGSTQSRTWLKQLSSSSSSTLDLGKVLKKNFFNWNRAVLWCCANLCCIAKWLSYTHIDVLFLHSFALGFITGYWI